MPYRRIANKIYDKKNGRWHLKQECKSVDNAKKAMRLLGMIGVRKYKGVK